MSDLYRLIYASRSELPGDAEARRREVDAILAASRAANRRGGITGALLLGADGFAQALEGRRPAVEAAFARIGRDPRHADVAVLWRGPAAARAFAGCDLACAGSVEDGRRLPPGLARLGDDAFCAAALALLRAEAGAAEARAGHPPRAFDADRLRAELDAGTPSRPTSFAVPDGEGEVLRAALEEERARTTDLRRALDEARVALARAEHEAEALGRHRDIWADRSLQQRASLREAREGRRLAEEERDASRAGLAAGAAELDRLRVHRDIWADRARALAAALCREPAARGEEAGMPRGEEAGTPRGGVEHPARERAPLRAAG